jgi:WD40-like Beta Propeller Repeat
MRERRWRVLAAGVLLLAACTSSQEPMADDVSPAPQVGATSTVSPRPSATLASGRSLPAGCDRRAPAAAQTVAFVAGGRAWALEPGRERLTCLFKVDRPGPFAWGPQGDRVLLGRLEVRGVTAGVPALPKVDAQPSAFDWGHPIGLAVVFAQPAARRPEKRFLDDGHIEQLPQLPGGTYLDVAYHPSGLALAFVIDRGGQQSIWLSTNEGADPVRLVFSKGGTRFTSIAFTPDGSRLVWTAQHAADYPQIHSMDLADRTGFTDGWRGEIGQRASNLHVAPSGRLMAIDEGSGCEDREAMFVLSPRVVRPALPDASGPSTVVGWLDRTTLLVGVGGCDEPLDLTAVDAAGRATPLVLGAEVAGTRTVTTSAPDSVPAPPTQVEEEPPPGGVG